MGVHSPVPCRATQANPCVLTIASSTPTLGQWIYVAGVGGMTQLNGRYFKVINVVGTAVSIGDLNGVNINSTGYTAYTSGGTSGTLYTISTPYAGADLALLKFSQTGTLPSGEGNANDREGSATSPNANFRAIHIEGSEAKL